MLRRMIELAESMPGYVSHKDFTADDGERVTIVEFEHEEGLRAWRLNPEHHCGAKAGAEEVLHRVSRPGLHARPRIEVQGGTGRNRTRRAAVPAAQG